MFELIKKLEQLKSFNIFSIVGWLYIVYLFVLIVWNLAGCTDTKCFFNFKSLLSFSDFGIYVLFFLIAAIIYTLLFIILLFLGIFEYFQEEDFIESEIDMWSYIFSIGLFVAPIIHVAFIIFILAFSVGVFTM